MPLQFEIENKNSILCFVPSGHRVGDKFVDLPKRAGYSCWYNATYQLIGMCHTQQGFDPAVQSPVVKQVDTLRARLELTFHMEFFCGYLVQVLFKQHPKETDKIFAFLNKDLTPNRLEGILLNIAEALHDPEKIRELKVVARRLVIEHYETFKKNCLALAKLVIDEKVNPLDETAEVAIKLCARSHFAAQDNKIYEEFFAIPVVHSKLGADDLIELSDVKAKEVHLKNTTYFNCMWKLYMRSNDIETTTSSAAINWLVILRELLERKGPIIMTGYVGCGYYQDAPKAVGKLGSLNLFGFSKDTYTPNPIGHAVLIIGMVNDKVIFLDPDKPAAVGERRAYVMNVDTFMARVIGFQSTIYGPDIVVYSQLDPKRIDTSLELMQQQTVVASVPTAKAKLNS